MAEVDSEAVWYVSQGGQRLGPFTRQALDGLLNSGKLTRSDLVWCPEFTDWKSVSEAFPAVPPPLPVKPATPKRDEPSKAKPATGSKPVKSVTPEFDVTTVENGETVELHVKTGSVGKNGFALFGLAILGAFGILAILFSLGSDDAKSKFQVCNVGLVLIALSYACGTATTKKNTTVVSVDARGIVVGRKRYDFEHISGFGYDSSAPGGFSFATVSNNPIAAASNAIGMAGLTAFVHAAQQFGQYIYIVYGTKRVPVVSGLTPENVEIVYDRFIECVYRYQSDAA